MKHCAYPRYDSRLFSFDRSVSNETTLDELFPRMNDDWVEAFPITDMQPRLPSGLDRDIYEHTPDEVDRPMITHEVWDTCPRHLDPFHLAKRARCTSHEAIQLADALSILDADSKLSSEICKWAYVRGIDATLKYLHRYLVGIAEAEHVTPEPQCDEEPVIGFQDIRPLRELTVAELRHECKRREIKASTRLRRWQLEAILDRADRTEIEPESGEPETIAYAPMCEGDPECDWIDSQAPWYQLLIMSIQEAETSEALGKIGIAVHERKLTGDKASVFWTFYNNRKAWLGRRFIVREKALEMAARIERAEPAKLGGIGIKLFELQAGKIKGPRLNKSEWSHVWATYHGRKSQLKAAA